MEYFTRYKLHKNGEIEEINVPKSEALKLIVKLLKQDKKMLSLLARL